MLFVAFFVCLNNLVSRVRVPVGVFYLNMSKKGKKQDVHDDRHLKILSCSILTCVRVCACVRVCVLRITKL